MTNLPLRPDGGIDWDKAMLMVVANSSHNTMHILTAIKREKEAVAATLERAAKWHEKQEIFWGRCISACKENEQTEYDVFVRGTIEAHKRGTIEAHKRSIASIRAMKP